MKEVSEGSDGCRCSTFRSRHAFTLPVETWADVFWNLRIMLCLAVILALPLVLLIAGPWACIAWIAASTTWAIREIRGYATHWDATSDD